MFLLSKHSQEHHLKTAPASGFSHFKHKKLSPDLFQFIGQAYNVTPPPCCGLPVLKKEFCITERRQGTT